jgi:predicted transcriptional regulator
LHYISDKLDALDYIISDDETEAQIKRVISAVNSNAQVLKSFYVDMIHSKDKKPAQKDKLSPLDISLSQRGSIIYLAFISHSISRMYLDPTLAKQMEPLFDSTKNPGYKNDRGDLEKKLYKVIEIVRKNNQ